MKAFMIDPGQNRVLFVKDDVADVIVGKIIQPRNVLREEAEMFFADNPTATIVIVGLSGVEFGCGSNWSGTMSPGQAFLVQKWLSATQAAKAEAAHLGPDSPLYGVDPYSWQPGTDLLAEAARLDAEQTT